MLTILCKYAIIIINVTFCNSVALVTIQILLGVITQGGKNMLDIKTATIIQRAINKYFLNKFSLEAVCRMQPVVQNINDKGYTIFALQSGDMTILVWVQVDETLGVVVRGVRTQAW